MNKTVMRPGLWDWDTACLVWRFLTGVRHIMGVSGSKLLRIYHSFDLLRGVEFFVFKLELELLDVVFSADGRPFGLHSVLSIRDFTVPVMSSVDLVHHDADKGEDEENANADKSKDHANLTASG
jgi:hypothetical protein